MATMQDVLDAVLSLVGRRDSSYREFANWSAGSKTGGPNADGYYPLTDASGKVRLVPCLEKIYEKAGMGTPTPTPTPPPTVNLNALSLSTASVPVNSAASINIVGTVVGSALAVSAGSLPTGMTLNSNARTITGTPTAAGTSNFSLTETSDGTTRTTALSIAVNAIAIPVSSIESDGARAAMVAPADLAFSTFAVQQAGFDATGAPTTRSRTRVTTKRERLAYPNQAQLTASGVWLDDYVYAADTIAGVTNNSTAVSPKPVCAHALPGNRVVGNTLTHEIVAFHRNGIACVIFTASDGTKSVSQTVANATILTGAADLQKVTGYACNLDISTLADDARITLNVRVYPLIGVAASVTDSADLTDLWRFANLAFYRSVTRTAAPPLAYVSTTGSDTTGVVSTDPAVAAANPFLTDRGALNKAAATLGTGADALSGLRVRFREGTYAPPGSTTNTFGSMSGEVVFEAAPGAARANTIFTFGATNISQRLQNTRFKGLTIRRDGVYYLGSVAYGQVIVEDCVFSLNENTGRLLSGTDMRLVFIGVTGSDLTAGSAFKASASQVFSLIRASNLSSATSTIFENRTVLGSKLKRAGPSVIRNESGTVLHANIFSDCRASMLDVAVGADNATTGLVDGIAIVQNVIEYTNAASGYALGISRDSLQAPTRHVILWHNTFAGAGVAGRWNFLYDEGPTRRTHTLQSIIGNLAVSIYTKSDLFRGQVEAGTDASLATGNWAFANGVGCHGNFTQYQSNTAIGGNQAQDYPGLSSNYGTSATARNNPLFVNDQATSMSGGTLTAGAGGGNYHITAGSPAEGLVSTTPLPFDLDGKARVALDAAGAYAKAA